MTKITTEQVSTEASSAEANPQAGGSYQRNEDGTLTKTEGTKDAVPVDKTKTKTKTEKE